MSENTITVKPLPKETTEQKVRQLFHSYSVNRVYINDNVAYVEFEDSSDLETLQMTFTGYKVKQLDDAEIDRLETFDWSSVKVNESKEKSSNQSDAPIDLSAADSKNLFIIKNCDQNILKNISVNDIKHIFSQFSSLNRIVKRDNQVIVEFLEEGDIDLLDMRFDDMQIPKLGSNAKIHKPQDSKISPHDFASQYSKMQSQLTNATVQHETEEKPSQEQFQGTIKLPFDKKTSMQVDFLNQQSNVEEKQQSKFGSIEEADTHQELNFASETEIQQSNEQKQKEEQQRKKQQQEDERKLKQAQEEEELFRKTLENQAKERLRREVQQRQQRQKQEQQKIEQDRKEKQRQDKLEQEKREQERLQKQRQDQKIQERERLANQKPVKNQLSDLQAQMTSAVNMARAQSAKLLESGKRTLQNLQEKTSSGWNVRPQSASRPVNKGGNHIPKALVTVTLLAWVVFLLMQ